MIKTNIFCGVLCLMIFRRIHAKLKEFSDENVDVTHNATTFTDIPNDCLLFGKDFDSSFPLHSLSLNISRQGVFWVAAKVGFRKNINPIGSSKKCLPKSEDVSLSNCSERCKDDKYFYHGENVCACEKNTDITNSLIGAEKCIKKGKIICLPDECIVYERVQDEDQYLCGTFTFSHLSGISFWLFKTANCSEKQQYSYICTSGKRSTNNITSHLSWYEAFQHCRDNGSNLVDNHKLVPRQYEDSRTYWVSFFRQTQFSWGTGNLNELCVAIKIFPNRTPEFVSKFCHEKLQAMCHVKNKIDKLQNRNLFLASLSGSLVGLILLLFIVSIVYIRHRQLKRQDEIQKLKKRQQNHAILKKRISGPLQLKKEENTLATNENYCDPWKTEPFEYEMECEALMADNVGQMKNRSRDRNDDSFKTDCVGLVGNEKENIRNSLKNESFEHMGKGNDDCVGLVGNEKENISNSLKNKSIEQAGKGIDDCVGLVENEKENISNLLKNKSIEHVGKGNYDNSNALQIDLAEQAKEKL